MRGAIKIIKQFEGLQLEAYTPPEGIINGWAIGYGYTRPWVHQGCRISEDWAEQLLIEELADIKPQLLALIKMQGLPENKLDALLSFVYNVGVGRFSNSTMLRKIKAGDLVGAGDEFNRWVYADHKKLPGLVKRRAAEKALFTQDTQQ